MVNFGRISQGILESLVGDRVPRMPWRVVPPNNIYANTLETIASSLGLDDYIKTLRPWGRNGAIANITNYLRTSANRGETDIINETKDNVLALLDEVDEPPDEKMCISELEDEEEEEEEDDPERSDEPEEGKGGR